MGHGLRRSYEEDAPIILAFEKLLGVGAPSRLHACAHAEPHWEHRRAAGTDGRGDGMARRGDGRWLAS